MESQPDDIELGRTENEQVDKLQQAYTLIRLIRNSIQPPYSPYAPLSNAPSIPRTSPERLALASPDSPDESSSLTVLYLAYGANLSKSTFDRLDVKPISQINVSAPAFDLAFDLPGIPYWEPRFSNITPRKIPKPPLDPPKPPFDPPKPPFDPPHLSSAKYPGFLLPSLPPGFPSWDKGLYGVVYEVTRDDYRKIIQAEGGGSAYQDILAPVLALPPPLNIPEKPPIPELPKPFIAHTLYAPRLPSLKPPGDGDDNDGHDNDGDDDDDPRDKKWWQKLLLPVRRPDSYGQPSARYLQLIRDGALEHYLPDDYLLYLAKLQAYKITTCRQEVGRWLFLLIWLPWFALILLLGFFFADKKDGKIPAWLGATSTVLANLMWKTYDVVFKPVFGSGERTIEEEEDDSHSRRMRNRGAIRNTSIWGSEKNALLGDW
ncbi:uncharacterized protein GGS22DRAFT_183727 [Annulohypoxylon maeteangense]|uniref:uncharacterized protein n=1 Tax=Annulohypoxylon maeteangense TaxID=1927788 RepID=UPI002007E352|nr:uncharacterized protein GGS22DRAFT_183727 [Annulohypoxylon maeteangense]KAI0890379.1 hypothetical protein GGS22DRAFT_183727 [Annulohypoxylon maeteangense]